MSFKHSNSSLIIPLIKKEQRGETLEVPEIPRKKEVSLNDSFPAGDLPHPELGLPHPAPRQIPFEKHY
jgi:hypothetical protein